MAKPRITLLDPGELARIHNTSLRILWEVGVRIHHPQVLEQMAAAGAKVDFDAKLARFDEHMVTDAIEKATKSYVLAGRDPSRIARLGYGDLNLISSPGQFAWFDTITGERREPVLEDARLAIRVGDALANITIVGAMTVPVDVPPPIRDVVLTAELLPRDIQTRSLLADHAPEFGVRARDLQSRRGRPGGTAPQPDGRGLPRADQPASTSGDWVGRDDGLP